MGLDLLKKTCIPCLKKQLVQPERYAITPLLRCCDQFMDPKRQ